MNERRLNLFDGAFNVDDGVRCNLHCVFSFAEKVDGIGDSDAFAVCEFLLILEIVKLRVDDE